MYQNVSQLTFIDQFTKMGRSSQFSYPALDALFEYYEELEESTGQPIELDVIGICCDWTEYDDDSEMLSIYGLDTLAELEDRTTVIELFHLQLNRPDKSWLVFAF